jgi:hypothetical protein
MIMNLWPMTVTNFYYTFAVQNPIFKSGYKAPLNINPGHAPGLAGKSWGFYRASPAVFAGYS